MRLQKYMAMCGVAAHRKCEEMIAAGRVTVNGRVITEMGTQVEEQDEVLVDGVRITRVLIHCAEDLVKEHDEIVDMP